MFFIASYNSRIRGDAQYQHNKELLTEGVTHGTRRSTISNVTHKKTFMMPPAMELMQIRYP